MESGCPPTQSRGGVVGASASDRPDDRSSEGKSLARILVATDGSRMSEHAVSFAVELAREYQSELLFVHVIPTLDPVAGSGSAEVGRAVRDDPIEDERRLLKDAAALATEHSVAATTTALVGSPVAEILAYAEGHDVNLIVVGSRGHGASAGVLLGSVSLGVLRASERPLVIVDGESSIAYCGNGSCPDVRIFWNSETNEASLVRSEVADMGGPDREIVIASIKRARTRVTSRAPGPVAHSIRPGPEARPVRSSGNALATRTTERIAGEFPSSLGLLSGAIRLESVVHVQDGAWAVTATIPYEGVIMLEEFTTLDLAREWLATADALVGS